MDDVIWRLRQRSRELREQRDDIRPIWDDAAAHTINERYLTPHEQDRERMETALVKQQQEVDAVSKTLTKAEELAHQAHEHADRAEEGLQLAREERTRANGALERYAHYKAGCAQLLPRIYAKIDQANSAC